MVMIITWTVQTGSSFNTLASRLFTLINVPWSVKSLKLIYYINRGFLHFPTTARLLLILLIFLLTLFVLGKQNLTLIYHQSSVCKMWFKKKTSWSFITMMYLVPELLWSCQLHCRCESLCYQCGCSYALSWHAKREKGNSIKQQQTNRMQGINWDPAEVLYDGAVK